MLTVRPLRESELEGLLRLYGHLHASDEALSPESAARTWRELLANPRHCHLGVFSKDELLASCALTVIPNLTRGGRPYGVIENVVTRSSHRRQGLGKRVLAEALSIAWAAGCYKVMLATGRRDEAVTKFYVSAGFSPDDKQAFVARPEA